MSEASSKSNESTKGLKRRDFLKKSALAVIGTSLSAGFLAACGDNTATSAAGATTAAAGATTAAAGASATTAAAGVTTAAAGASVTTAAAGATTTTVAAAATGAPIKVGVLITFTGPYTVIGNDVLDGVNLYFSSIGNQIAGRPIQIIKEDEGSTPDNALQRAKKLVEQDKVDFIVGIALTNDYLAMRDYLDQNKTVLIIANAGANAVVTDKFSKYIYRASFGNGQYTYPLGLYASKNMGKKAVLLAPDYAAGKEATSGFGAGFKQGGGTVLKEIYSALGQTTDYAPFLTQVQDAKPEMTYAFYSGVDTINWIKQYDQFGLKKTMPLAGNFAIDENSLAQMGSAAEGVVYSSTWAVTLDTPANKKFIADYKAKFKKDVGATVCFGYDAAQMVAAAVNGTKGDTADKVKLAAAMEGIKLDSPRGTITVNAKNHGLVQNIYNWQIVKGSDGKLTSKLVKTWENVPEIGDLLANGLPNA
jgi:branched-chain amino acid transport system substrate-binding protein